MNEELISQIEELGLSEKEAKVYAANLMIGPATVQQIANQSGIKRVTTYVILESLSNLGLVSQSNKGKKTFFTAEEPTALRRLLDKKEQQLEDQKKSFEELLPSLASLKNVPIDLPDVRFYDSAEGIRTIFTSFLETHRKNIDMVYGISNLDQLHSFFPEIKEASINPSRVKVKIPSRFLYTTERGPIYKETDSESLRESRWVPLNEFPLNGDINIVGDYIVMLSLTGNRPLGITIHSKELAAGMKEIHRLAWEAAKKYNQN